MDFDILNLNNVNYEEKIKEVIKEIKEEYKDLTTKRTCFIYSGIVKEKLQKKHVISRIISTKDLGLSYDHRFVLVKEKDMFYLIDLTYNQFFDEIPKEFEVLNNCGYQKVDESNLYDYIYSIIKEPIRKDVEELFYK